MDSKIQEYVPRRVQDSEVRTGCSQNARWLWTRCKVRLGMPMSGDKTGESAEPVNCTAMWIQCHSGLPHLAVRAQNNKYVKKLSEVLEMKKELTLQFQKSSKPLSAELNTSILLQIRISGTCYWNKLLKCVFLKFQGRQVRTCGLAPGQ